MPNGEWHDITVLLRRGTPEWPGDTPYDCHWAWDMALGASVNVSVISGSPHVGTHADAPLHVRPGAPGSDRLPVDAFVGPAWVADVRQVTGILTLQTLGIPANQVVHRLLLRTGCTIAAGAFPLSWPALDALAITTLLQRGLRLLGVDAPSVDVRESKTLANHHLIFDGGACVLENLDLRDVTSGPWDLVAPPLKLEGLDAAPVRALLRAPAA